MSSGGLLKFRQLLFRQRDYRLKLMRLDPLVALYRKTFGETAVHLVPFELLQDNPSAFISQIAAILGVEDKVGASAPVNPSISRSEIRLLRHISAVVRHAVPDPKDYEEYRRTLRRAVTAILASDDPFVRRNLRWLRHHIDAEPVEIPAGYLEPLRGTATVLENNPLYDNYRSLYLLD
jgi:hypothetical protein